MVSISVNFVFDRKEKEITSDEEVLKISYPEVTPIDHKGRGSIEFRFTNPTGQKPVPEFYGIDIKESNDE